MQYNFGGAPSENIGGALAPPSYIYDYCILIFLQSFLENV